MSAQNGVKLIFGGGLFMNKTVDVVNEWLGDLDEFGIKTIDTAEIYGASEEILGQGGAASRFAIDTKNPGAWGPVSTTDAVIASGKASLAKLKADSFDVYYVHAPDHRVPWKETLTGLNELHKQGAFKRLGLSNFSAKDVDEFVQVAKENNFILPTVYQGNYSAVARRTEEEILPTLRKHNISFYAYSPIAGGFLAKSAAELQSAAEGRFSGNNPLANVYNGMYNRPSFIAALDTWGKIAEDEGITRSELAYRWIAYHSKLQGDLGDAIVVGARKREQLRESVTAIKSGPLSDAAAKRVADIWESVKGDAALDNFEMLSAAK